MYAALGFSTGHCHGAPLIWTFDCSLPVDAKSRFPHVGFTYVSRRAVIEPNNTCFKGFYSTTFVCTLHIKAFSSVNMQVQVCWH